MTSVTQIPFNTILNTAGNKTIFIPEISAVLEAGHYFVEMNITFELQPSTTIRSLQMTPLGTDVSNAFNLVAYGIPKNNIFKSANSYVFNEERTITPYIQIEQISNFFAITNAEMIYTRTDVPPS